MSELSPELQKYVLLSEKDFPLHEELAYLSNGYFDTLFEDQQEFDVIRKQLAPSGVLTIIRKCRSPMPSGAEQ